MYFLTDITQSLQCRTLEAINLGYGALDCLSVYNVQTQRREGVDIAPVSVPSDIGNDYTVIVPGPTLSHTQNNVKSVNVNNTDNIKHTLEFSINQKIFYKCTLSPGWTVVYTDESGWSVYDERGIKKKDNTDFYLEIAKGNVEGHRIITKSGYNSDVDTGSVPEDIINPGGAYVPPTAARIHNIKSTSALDAVGSTGCEKVLVYGVLDDYSRATETVSMNGTGDSLTTNAYRHIHLMQNTTNDGGVNVGTITATAEVDATVTCTIAIGEGQSESTVFLVPLGETAYIEKVRARMNNSTASSAATVALYTIPFGKALQLKVKMGINNSGSSWFENDYSKAPYIVPEKSWIRFKCTNVTNNNTEIMGEYDLILVES